MSIRLAASTDAGTDPQERALRRIGLPVAKYWVCKRAGGVVGEALECLGGNGYVEESGMPRLYREAPLNSIWEGAGNIQALDVLRVLAREPDAVASPGTPKSRQPRAPTVIWMPRWSRPTGCSGRSRRVIPPPVRTRHEGSLTRMAVLLQASLLVRFAPTAVADVFCAARLAGVQGTFGELPPGLDVASVLARATPEPS